MRPLTWSEVWRILRQGRGSKISPYEHGYGYCRACEGWWRVDEVPKDRFGRPCCPIHGKNIRVLSVNKRGRRFYPEVELHV